MIQPTYYVKHPDNSFSEANPQPEISALKARVAELDEELNAYKNELRKHLEYKEKLSLYENIIAELQQSRASIEADRLGAERYRWLKGNKTTRTTWYDEEGVDAIELEFKELGEDLDAAIDDAMAQESKS